MDWIWDGKPYWLTHLVYDHLKFIPKILCFCAGHEAVRDHCLLPHHDYCMWCNKPMPDQAGMRVT